MTAPPCTDPKRECGAYIAHNGHLYEVIGYEQTGPRSGKLHVLNCLTDHPVWLTEAEVQEAEFVRSPALAAGVREHTVA